MTSSERNPMAECLNAAQIAGVLGDTLPPEELTRVEAHLQSCDRCRTAVDTKRDDRSSDRNAATIDAPSPVTLADKLPWSIEELSSLLFRSGLLTSDELEAFLNEATPPDKTFENADDVASALIDAKRLTRFQLDWLREGKTEGLVLGNYVLLDKLGAGGMGVVYKARHRRMKRDVALKVLPEALTRSPDAVARFHREVEAAARLQHPNIAAAYDADDADGVHFLVMEYVDGPDLSRFVKQHGPLPLAHALALCIQAARGLGHAHKLGVVHRDIKPGNLLVDQHGSLKILDMGLAHLHGGDDASGTDVTELTQSGRIMGTVDYMAPEQAVNAKRADHRADIYSLGCTLYYLTTGRSISPDGSMTEKLLWHQSGTVTSLSNACPGAPSSLDAALAKLLERRPEDRPQSMGDVIRLLEPCLAEITADGAAPVSPLPGPLANVEISPSIYSGTLVNRSTIAEVPAPQAAAAPPARRGGWLWVAVGGGGLAAAAILLAVAFKDSPVDQNAEAQGEKGAEKQVAASSSAATEVKVAAEAPRPEDQVLARIFTLGGKVTVANANGLVPGNINRHDALPPAPFEVRGILLDRAAVDKSLLESFGKFAGLQNVSLAGAKVDDEDLAGLAAVPTLLSLDLSQTAIGDRGAEQIARLTNLVDLNLSGTRLTARGVKWLAPLTRLEKLYLADTVIGDAGLAELRPLSALKYLVVSGAQVTADGFAALVGRQPDVEVVWDGPDVERQVARKLVEKGGKLRVAPGGAAQKPETATIERTVDLPAGRFEVVEVDLSGNPAVNDDDLRLVGRLRHLESLNLDGTAVTSVGLAALNSLTTLKKLDLGSLQVSQTSLGQLAQALPQCDIHRSETNERNTAAWVLQTGGSLTLATPEGEVMRDVTQVEQLPRGPFVIREAVLSGKPAVGDDDLAKFRGFGRLELLNLSGTGVTDAGIDHLLTCTGLRTLDLSQTALTPAAAPALSRLRTLRQLYLSGTGINGESLGELARLAALTHLAVAKTAIKNADILRLRPFNQLVWLSIGGLPVADSAIENLIALKTLRELNVVDTELSDAGLEQLQLGLPQCRILSRPMNPERLAARWVLEQGGAVTLLEGETPRTLERLSQLPRGACRVVGINLASARSVGDDGLKPLLACRELADLNLKETAVSDESLAELAPLKKLRKISLARTRVTDDALATLKTMPSLQSIDLGSTRITGRTFGDLTELPSLTSLFIDHCRVTDAAFADLARLSGLKSLVASYNTQLTDRGLAALEDLTKLERLDLAGTRVTDASAERIGRYVELRRLDLSGTRVSDALVGRLAGLRNLERLYLQGTEVTDSALSSLSQLRNLRELDVTQTRVTQSAADQLKQAIPGLEVYVATRARQPNGRGQSGPGGQ